MPYKDPEKLKLWRQKLYAQRKEARAAERAARVAEVGHHTKVSLTWPKPALTEAQAFWIAACIDCEGCLSLGSYWNKRRNSYNFHVSAQVQMTDAAIPNHLCEICGGGVFYSERTIVKRRAIWAWHLGANGVRWLLPQIIDKLMVKRRQAELLIEFLTLSQRGVSDRAEINPRAQEIRAEMRWLNQRGIPTSPSGGTSEAIDAAEITRAWPTNGGDK